MKWTNITLPAPTFLVLSIAVFQLQLIVYGYKLGTGTDLSANTKGMTLFISTFLHDHRSSHRDKGRQKWTRNWLRGPFQEVR